VQQQIHSYVQRSSEVLQDNGALAATPMTLAETFKQTAVTEHKSRLRGHFEKLAELDEEYTRFLVAHGSINELQMRSAALQIAGQARGMLVGAVKNYESSIEQREGHLKFRLNVTIGVIAIVVTLMGAIIA
jgi:hypothetical protein